MTVMMPSYKASNPSAATADMRGRVNAGHVCPMCGRVAKWYYRYYEATSEKDKPFRCALHEITPVPGPNYAEDHEKVYQLY